MRLVCGFSERRLLEDHLLHRVAVQDCFFNLLELGHKSSFSMAIGFIELVVWNGKDVVGMNAFDRASEGKLTVLHDSS